MIRTLTDRRLVSLILVMVFLVIGVLGFKHLADKRKSPEARIPEEKRLNVDVFQVGTEDIRQTLRGFGTVQADREVILSAEVAGAIDRVHPDFEVGLYVISQPYSATATPDQEQDAPLIEGDELVVIDQGRYLGQVKQITSQIKELVEEQKLTETELSNAEEVQALATRDYDLILLDLARQKELQKRGVLSQAELNRVELEVQQYQKNKTLADREFNLANKRLRLSELKVDTLEVQNELLEDDLARTVIRPPFDGYLSEVFVEVGQYVRPGDPVARITNIERIEIPVSLTLDDYDKLKPQLDREEKPAVGLSLHEGEPPVWTGAVVRHSPEANRETRTITVFVEVENTRQEVPLLPGTFVFARIEGPVYESEQNTVIPRDAIIGNRVFLAKEGFVAAISVEILERLQSVAVVKGKLMPGDRLVLTNLNLLAPGLPIEISDRVHRLTDELDPHDPWKSYWEILPVSKATAQTHSPSATHSATSEKAEVTE